VAQNTPRRCVVDASVAAKWHFPETLSERAAALLDRQDAGALEIYAPELILYEFGSVVAKKLQAGQVVLTDAEAVLREFASSPPRLVPATEALPLALRFTQMVHASFYDSTYLAAAELVEGTLVTADERLASLTVGTLFGEVVRLLSEADPDQRRAVNAHLRRH